MSTIKPISTYNVTGDLTLKSEGQKQLLQGKVATVVLAGGQGSRLGGNLPKGCFQITPITNKSLFQLICEKTIACGNKYGIRPSLSIMTSPDNHNQTVTYFEENRFFGIEGITFFTQSTFPILTEQSTIFMHKGAPLLAPDGNGSLFWNMQKNGLLNRWKAQGIEYVTVVVVDNALADPFDYELISACRDKDISLKTIERLDPEEKVGVVVEEKGFYKVLEYSELDSTVRYAKDTRGKLLFRHANISQFCFHLPFIERICKRSLNEMPVHNALKQIPEHTEKVIKREYFLFDVLSLTSSVNILLGPREDTFAPLKNKIGPDSPETVQSLLLNRDKRLFEKVSRTVLPEHVRIELGASFHYPTPELLAKWRGKGVQIDSYIES